MTDYETAQANNLKAGVGHHSFTTNDERDKIITQLGEALVSLWYGHTETTSDEIAAATALYEKWKKQ